MLIEPTEHLALLQNIYSYILSHLLIKHISVITYYLRYITHPIL
jgi:hypothetical protein